MSLAEFLDWDDGTDRRYELLEGRIVAMAPPLGAHAIIVGNLARAVGNRLRPPCYVAAEAGIVPPDRADTWYQADLVVSCTPLPRTARWFDEPVLIGEVLSPSTTVHDFKTKLPDYQRMPSVREVMLVASGERRVEIWQRAGTTWRHEVSTGDEAVAVEAIGGSIPLAEVYANLTL